MLGRERALRLSALPLHSVAYNTKSAPAGLYSFKGNADYGCERNPDAVSGDGESGNDMIRAQLQS